MKLPRCLSLPLMGRELTESANRRRTYVLRSCAALVALGVFGFALAELIGANSQYINYYGYLPQDLGIGRYPLEALTTAQLGIIALLLPAMGAVSVTQEKERGTLVLLLMTLMAPWQLVTQKWLSLCLLMVGMLLVSLPLYAVSYAHGGVDKSMITAHVLAIITMIAVTASTSLAVSSWCRRSVGAIVLSYVVLLMLYVLWPVIQESRGHWFVSSLIPDLPPAALTNPLCLIRDWERHPDLHYPFIIVPTAISVVMLILARVGIVRRAESDGGIGILPLLRWLDTRYALLEVRLMRRQVLRSLPVRAPVFWLEVNRRSLTNARYLVRLLLPWYVLLLILALSLHDRLDEVYAGGLAIVLLMTAVWHAGLLSSERSQQTLDVLLASPMSAASILVQKTRALARLRWGMTGSLVLVALIDAFLRPLPMDAATPPWERILPTAVLAKIVGAIVLPALVGWVSVIIGLVTANQRRAAMGAIIVNAIWLLGVPLALTVFLRIAYGQALAGQGLLFLTPVLVACDSSLVTAAHVDFSYHGFQMPEMHKTQFWWLEAMGALYVGVWVMLRGTCLGLGARLLGASRSAH